MTLDRKEIASIEQFIEFNRLGRPSAEFYLNFFCCFMISLIKYGTKKRMNENMSVSDNMIIF